MSFGSIFKYQEKEFVYLDRSEEIIYVAHIMNKEQSKLLIKCRDKSVKNSNQSYKLGQNTIYCFVELKTEGFLERVAHYGLPPLGDDPQYDFSPDDIIGHLCDDDIKELHDEITENDLAVAPELKERIQKISI